MVISASASNRNQRAVCDPGRPDRRRASRNGAVTARGRRKRVRRVGVAGEPLEPVEAAVDCPGGVVVIDGWGGSGSGCGSFAGHYRSRERNRVAAR